MVLCLDKGLWPLPWWEGDKESAVHVVSVGWRSGPSW